jgi:hypothetical protein
LKTIGRLLILLLVIGVVTAGLYFQVENGGSSNTGFDPRNEGGFDGREGGVLPPSGVLQGNRPSHGRFEGEHEGGERGAFSFARGFVGIIGNLIQIGVITFLVVGLQRLLARNGSSKPDPV